MNDKATTIGIDMGDKKNEMCAVDSKGKVLERETQPNTPEFTRKYYSAIAPRRIVLEAGAQSTWFAETLRECGHEVIVANPRKTRLIGSSSEKNDRRDAEMLARLGNADPGLLHPVQLKSTQEQADIAVLKARDSLVAARTSIIEQIRSQAKCLGSRIDSCDADCFHLNALEQIPDSLRPALEPLVQTVGHLTRQIRSYDRQIELLCKQHPETERLREIGGVGAITSLFFVLTIGDCERFENSRSVGPYTGLTPKHHQSGQVDKLLNISKEGNETMRRLLVGSARYILGPFGKDCDLRRFGMHIMERGGKSAKGRAAIAVARKLAVLMHSLLKNETQYDPFHQAGAAATETAA